MMDEYQERNQRRDDQILAAATRLVRARQISLDALTRGIIAQEAGLATSSVSNYGQSRITKGKPRTAGVVERIVADVLAEGVAQADLCVVAAGLAARHPVALAAPDDLRIAALASFA